MIMRAETTSGLNTQSHASASDIGSQHRKAMFGLGFRSMLRVGFALFGSMAARFHRSLAGTTRLEHGLIIILPGIEGCSSINDSIARGLVAGQLPHAIRIIDWRRFRPWNPLHQIRFRPNMIKCWNFGGHFGSTNAVFVRRHIAPILLLR